MSARFRAVVWDVDGVLIDSEPLHLENLAHVCGRYGYAFEEAENQRWLGKSFAEMWRMMPELRRLGRSYNELLAELLDYYVAHVHAGMARPPAPEVVAGLARRGVPQAAASSSPRRIVDANIAAVGVTAHLGAALAIDDVARGKPAPDLYLAAVARLDVAPQDCLAVEDTESGVAAAKAAGLGVIAWPHDMTAGMDFSRADWLIGDLLAFAWDEAVAA
ncbi:MAG: HAD family hydrolase [Alphaproteobacteria bacterium]